MSTPEKERVPGAPAPVRARSGWRPLVLRLHFYAGILVAPFILVAAVSGGLYAVAPSLEQLVYSDQLSVTPGGPALPVAEQVRAAESVRPDLTVSAVRPAAEPGDTTRVMFDDPSLGESEQWAVFLDPATARPLGELAVYGSSGSLPLRTWISELHRTLHLGEPGRLYSELAASWLGVIALGGLALWVERYRRSRGARLLTVDRSTTGRRRTLGRHGAVGAWIAAGLVFLSATGLTWSTYAGANVTELRSALSWSTPAVATTLGGAASSTGGDHTDHTDHTEGQVATTSGAGSTSVTAENVDRLDAVLATAAGAGLTGALEVSVPGAAGTAAVVSETRQAWVFHNDSVAVDPATGRVTDVLRFADWPLAAQLAAWGIQLHMGTLLGLGNQLALLALAVALVTVVVRGYLLWWRRRPTRSGALGVGRAPRAGAVRGLSPAAAVAVGAATLLVGWFVPLLGLSLLAFLLVDVAVRTVRRSRPAAAHRPADGGEAPR